MNDLNHLTRREFLRYAAGLGLSASGIALLDACGTQSEPAAPAAEAQLETTTLKLSGDYAICQAPQGLAEEFLKAEGFTDVQYLSGPDKTLASGGLDVDPFFSPVFVTRVDKGDPITMLAGMQVGCFELFGNERVQAISDLKGKNVGGGAVGGLQNLFVASMMTYIGIDPNKDINWVVQSTRAEAMQSLADGKIDAYLGTPPFPQEARAKKIGHVVVNSMMDKPWSHYFCCMIAANREFVRKNPVATKRALRAYLKAADVCAREPERVARFLVDKGITKNYDFALQFLRECQEAGAYSAWREFDPEDTLRFYALRLNEAGMVKGSPNDIIARGTDWRFFNELKKEMKG